MIKYCQDFLKNENAIPGNYWASTSGNAVAIEIKYDRDGNLERQCEEALEQIERNDYDARLVEDDL